MKKVFERYTQLRLLTQILCQSYFMF